MLGANRMKIGSIEKDDVVGKLCCEAAGDLGHDCAYISDINHGTDM